MPALLRPIGPTARASSGRDTHHREDNVVNTPPAATGQPSRMPTRWTGSRTGEPVLRLRSYDSPCPRGLRGPALGYCLSVSGPVALNVIDAPLAIALPVSLALQVVLPGSRFASARIVMA